MLFGGMVKYQLWASFPPGFCVFSYLNFSDYVRVVALCVFLWVRSLPPSFIFWRSVGDCCTYRKRQMLCYAVRSLGSLSTGASRRSTHSTASLGWNPTSTRLTP